MQRPILAAAVLAAASFAAQASTVELTGFVYNPPDAVNLSDSAVSLPYPAVYAGAYTGMLDGNAFSTYCVDLFQTSDFGTTFTDYTLQSGTAAWGAQKAAEMDHLFSYGAGYVHDAATSAVFQAAVWEVVNETQTDGSGNFVYGFGSGVFGVTSGSVGAGLAGFDWTAASSAPVTLSVSRLASPTGQDLTVITPVPEPSTIALLALGLVGIACVAHRRRDA